MCILVIAKEKYIFITYIYRSTWWDSNIEIHMMWLVYRYSDMNLNSLLAKWDKAFPMHIRSINLENIELLDKIAYTCMMYIYLSAIKAMLLYQFTMNKSELGVLVVICCSSNSLITEERRNVPGWSEVHQKGQLSSYSNNLICSGNSFAPFCLLDSMT